MRSRYQQTAICPQKDPASTTHLQVGCIVVLGQSLQALSGMPYGAHAYCKCKYLLRHTPCSAIFPSLHQLQEYSGAHNLTLSVPQTSAAADAKQAEVKAKHLQKQLAEQQRDLKSSAAEAQTLARQQASAEAAIQQAESRYVLTEGHKSIPCSIAIGWEHAQMHIHLITGSFLLSTDQTDICLHTCSLHMPQSRLPDVL